MFGGSLVKATELNFSRSVGSSGAQTFALSQILTDMSTTETPSEVARLVFLLLFLPGN